MTRGREQKAEAEDEGTDVAVKMPAGQPGIDPELVDEKRRAGNPEGENLTFLTEEWGQEGEEEVEEAPGEEAGNEAREQEHLEWNKSSRKVYEPARTGLETLTEGS